MAARQPRYNKEEFTRPGDAIYETQVRTLVEAENQGKFVAINIETGAFEVADDTMTATQRLRERIQDPQPWVVSIGYRAVHRFGSRSLKDNP